MITIYYLENGRQQKKTFNVPPEEEYLVLKVLKDADYNWFAIDRGSRIYNPDQLTLQFGEIQ